ncbi:hypothetical protein OE88DRAFT_1654192 [Heliocybe sulcata]|uniref:Uncharacterized protein n=1 Tax=Heliocybe sulcata TaxID=5364 RepID=A0A5C3NBN7_9AGAM|nr:hypothetical protein OE88DRAFT_1654192 [Heliocybe sulcata]
MPYIKNARYHLARGEDNFEIQTHSDRVCPTARSNIEAVGKISGETQARWEAWGADAISAPQYWLGSRRCTAQGKSILTRSAQALYVHANKAGRARKAVRLCTQRSQAVYAKESNCARPRYLDTHPYPRQTQPHPIAHTSAYHTLHAHAPRPPSLFSLRSSSSLSSSTSSYSSARRSTPSTFTISVYPFLGAVGRWRRGVVSDSEEEEAEREWTKSHARVMTSITGISM